MKCVSTSLEETKTFAETLLNVLKKEKDLTSQALVLNLSGNLGTGKTTMVKMIGELLGVLENITSPTFVLRNDYKTKDSKIKKLIHMDVFRIEKDEEMDTLCFDDLIKEKNTLVAIEWGEIIKNKLPKGTFKLSCVVSGDEHTFNFSKEI